MSENNPAADNPPSSYEIASAADIATTTMNFVDAAGQDYLNGMSPASAAFSGACQVGLAAAMGFIAGASAGSVPSMAAAAAGGSLVASGFADLCNVIGSAMTMANIANPAPTSFDVAGASFSGAFAGWADINVGIDSNGNVGI